MSQRERFEQWVNSQPFGKIEGSAGHYQALTHFDIWQAAERSALERAAQLCEQFKIYGLGDLPAMVRALSEPDQQKEKA